MKRKIELLISIILILMLFMTSFVYADVYVKGYYRGNGTFVQPYYRASPDSTSNDNYSTYPNINPYTDEQGTIAPTPYYYTSYTPYTPTILNTPTALVKPSFPVYVNDNCNEVAGRMERN